MYPRLHPKLYPSIQAREGSEQYHEAVRHTNERHCCGIAGGGDCCHYAIRVEGCLDPGRWSAWFDGMTFRCEPRADRSGVETVIEGPVADQAALHGLLIKVRDLHLTLVSVERTAAAAAAPSRGARR